MEGSKGWVGMEGMGGYGYGRDGREGEGRMYAVSCEGNARIPRTVVGRNCPSFAIRFASPYFALLPCCIDAMSASHAQYTPKVGQLMTPTHLQEEILPKGMTVCSRGRVGPRKPCDGLRRDVASHCARAREAQRRVAANCHTQHAVKSCVPRRAVSSRLPMPPPCRVYT